MRRTAAVIPARMAASRFPGKPLAEILGMPMIEHVRRRVLLSGKFDEVWVATCDEEIMSVVEENGGKAVMTSDSHERCTDRVEEAAKGINADVIGIIQGDEPLIIPDFIETLMDTMISDDGIYCANIVSEIEDLQDLKNTDIVKAIVSLNDDIMYFSRAEIPYFRDTSSYTCFRQTGISAFTSEFLKTYTKTPQSPLEKAESVDFLRILENGYTIKAVKTRFRTYGVDRKEDVKIIEDILNNDSLQNEYYKRTLEL
ncbi:MAG: 3-deoxy-manno-octulosonate cytidylyltransferase [Methanomicrobiaceae archaeon]|nr:3-deoxy-manno-octulosonate cytidylyltransferase [Methanomicrobiaceae archaeon]